jgi:hypothetical protein
MAGSGKRAATDTSSSFRQLGRNPDLHEGVRFIARTTDGSLNDPDLIDRVVNRFRSGVEASVANPIVIHGFHTEKLFESMVAALGNVKLLKAEDTGDCYLAGEDLKLPDFRIVTAAGEQILVEVKNHHRKGILKPFTVPATQVDQLVRYANLVQLPSVKFAIYWSRLQMWSLTDASVFERVGSRCVLEPTAAMMASEMALIGDRTLGSEWPIGLTLHADRRAGSTIAADGTFPFTVGAAQYTVAGRVIREPSEQQIVNRLMRYGGWVETTDLDVVDNEVRSISFIYSPEGDPPPQGFAMYRPLSTVFSRMFAAATTNTDGDVDALRMNFDPGAFGAMVPDDYEGVDLGLWRFTIMPKEAAPTL